MCAGGQRKRRAAPRQRRQAAGAAGQEVEEDVEAEFNPENPYQVSHTHKRDSHGSSFSSSLVFTLGCGVAAVRSDLRPT